MRQTPLIDPGGNELPSPIFKPRPGWGGQLKAWAHDNLFRAIFRMVLVTALVLLGGALIRSWDIRRTEDGTLTQSPLATSTYEYTAEHAQGMTHLAAQAIAQYRATRSTPVRLDAAQILYAIDTLARHAGWRPLERGEKITFDPAVIDRIVTEAQALTPQQHTAWTRYVK